MGRKASKKTEDKITEMKNCEDETQRNMKKEGKG